MYSDPPKNGQQAKNIFLRRILRPPVDSEAQNINTCESEKESQLLHDIIFPFEVVAQKIVKTKKGHCENEK